MRLVLLASILAMALLFGCAGNPAAPDNSSAPSTAAPAAASPPGVAAPGPGMLPQASVPQTPAVQIKDSALSPATLTVTKGTKVTWTNLEDMPHTVTSDAGAFGSGTLQNGQAWSFTFDTPGAYKYGCSIHANMKGYVIVTG